MRCKNYFYSVIFIILLLTLTSCKNIVNTTTTTITSTTSSLNDKIECNNDSDCNIGGCSSQICGNKGKIKDIITTCEYKSEYECLKKTNCGCVNSKCAWKENPEYLNCLREKR